MFGFGGNDVSLTMDKPHPESLLDSSVQDVIGKPLDRVDGPKKVSGAATYAAEYQLDNLAHGVLVGATIGKGKVVSIEADKVKAMPGVIDVVTDFDTFIRVSQQGGETSAPAQGVKAIEYFGQIIAIVIGETFRSRARRRRAARGGLRPQRTACSASRSTWITTPSCRRTTCRRGPSRATSKRRCASRP